MDLYNKDLTRAIIVIFGTVALITMLAVTYQLRK